MESLQAIIRIDAQPSGKKFQGVWLELADGVRWVISYRPRELWRAFEDLAVTVTAERYTPATHHQQINAQHVRIGTVALVDRRAARRFYGCGAEREVSARSVAVDAPADSKLAVSGARRLAIAGEAEAWIAGADETVPAEQFTALIRDVDINPAWVAGPGGPHVWLVSVR